MENILILAIGFFIGIIIWFWICYKNLVNANDLIGYRVEKGGNE